MNHLGVSYLVYLVYFIDSSIDQLIVEIIKSTKKKVYNTAFGFIVYNIKHISKELRTDV